VDWRIAGLPGCRVGRCRRLDGDRSLRGRDFLTARLDVRPRLWIRSRPSAGWRVSPHAG